MRNTILPILLACLSLAASAASATEPPPPPKPASDEKPLRFAFITCCKDAPFYDPAKKGMRDAAAKMNVTCDWLGTDGVDVAAQAALVRRAVADGYNGIALSIIDPKAFDAVVEEAIRRGVPVVAFNVDDNATPNARLSGVCQRFVAAGNALAARVAADIPNGATSWRCFTIVASRPSTNGCAESKSRCAQEPSLDRHRHRRRRRQGRQAHRRRLAARPGDSRHLRHRPGRYRGGRPHDREAIRRSRLLGRGL